MAARSTAVEIGGEFIDLFDFAVAAIEMFGGVRLQHADWLAEKVAKFFNEGNLGRKIIRDGTPIPPDLLSKFELGPGSALCIEAVRAIESDALYDDASGAIDMLATRIAAWAYGEQRRRTLSTMAMSGSRYRSVNISPMANACSEMLQLSEFSLPLNAAPLIPLPSCRNKRCHCSLKPSFEPPNAVVRSEGSTAAIDRT